MLRLSKKADYALMAMKHLAIKPDLSSTSAREIAEQYDIPIELMAKVLQRLARSGLLTSHQGTRGGYTLARPVAAISVRRRTVRPVRQVQRARPALAHQGPDPFGAGDLLARRDLNRGPVRATTATGPPRVIHEELRALNQRTVNL